jgi:hypothetical protein
LGDGKYFYRIEEVSDDVWTAWLMPGKKELCIEAHDPTIGAHLVAELDVLDSGKRLGELTSIRDERGCWGDLL